MYHIGDWVVRSSGAGKEDNSGRRTVFQFGRISLVFAYLELKNHVLKKDSYIDLMPFVEGKGEEAVVRCQLPQTDQGIGRCQ